MTEAELIRRVFLALSDESLSAPKARAKAREAILAFWAGVYGPDGGE